MAQKGVNSQPAAPALIRHTPFTDDESGPDLRRILPAWIISGVFHVVLLSIFLLFTFGKASGSTVEKEETVTENKVDDDESYKDKNLTNDELGNDPDSPTNYNLDRIDPEQSVPGPVNPNESVGILNAPMNVPPQTVAPPPGFGGGQGGGVDSDKTGTGSMLGFAGGVGGKTLIPGGVGGRSGATREKMLKEGGGNSASEAAVAGGLKWLARHQFPDGHWGLHNFSEANKCTCGQPGAGGHDIAGTAFGLLPMLGAGETHRAVGKNNIYAKNVERGLQWLCTKQGADGQLGDGYSHAIATIVLCEAYGLTSDPWLKPHAQRAIRKVVDWQAPDGGFRYGPKQPGDLSVAGWHIQALKSGAMSGLNVPQATMKGVDQFLDKVASGEGSKYGYTGPQENNYRLSAVGLLARQYMGWGPRTPGLVKGVEELKKIRPGPNPKDMYYFYYATQVMHHMAAVQPDTWAMWNDGPAGMRDLLIKSQDNGANADKRDQKGSWDPTGDQFGPQLGRVGYTSLCLLTLEVYYRHLPLYRRELGSAKDAAILNK